MMYAVVQHKKLESYCQISFIRNHKIMFSWKNMFTSFPYYKMILRYIITSFHYLTPFSPTRTFRPNAGNVLKCIMFHTLNPSIICIIYFIIIISIKKEIITLNIRQKHFISRPPHTLYNKKGRDTHTIDRATYEKGGGMLYSIMIISLLIIFISLFPCTVCI